MTENSETIILVISGVVLCVLMAIITGVIMYRRKQRQIIRQDIQNMDLGIEEETTDGPTTTSTRTQRATRPDHIELEVEHSEKPPSSTPKMVIAVSDSATVDIDLDASDMSD